MKRTLLVVSILVLLCAAAHGVTWTVDWVGGGDFLTIEEGLFAAAYGDTVYVLAGYYNEHVLMKDGVCLLGEGADCTIVDGTGWDFSTITCDGTFGPDTIIEGFRIQNGNGPYWSASGVWLGIDCSAVVQYNVMIGNTMGVMVNYNDGNPVIDHNTIVFNNDCGIQIYVGNDTIVTGVATITNNIIFDNGNYGIYRGSDSSVPDPPEPLNDYNDVYMNGIADYLNVAMGVFDIAADPQFCMAPSNLDLRDSSPCIGSGYGGTNMGALKPGCGSPVEDTSWGSIKALFR